MGFKNHSPNMHSCSSSGYSSQSLSELCEPNNQIYNAQLYRQSESVSQCHPFYANRNIETTPKVSKSVSICHYEKRNLSNAFNHSLIRTSTPTNETSEQSMIKDSKMIKIMQKSVNNNSDDVNKSLKDLNSYISSKKMNKKQNISSQKKNTLFQGLLKCFNCIYDLKSDKKHSKEPKLAKNLVKSFSNLNEIYDNCCVINEDMRMSERHSDYLSAYAISHQNTKRSMLYYPNNTKQASEENDTYESTNSSPISISSTPNLKKLSEHLHSTNKFSEHSYTNHLCFTPDEPELNEQYETKRNYNNKNSTFISEALQTRQNEKWSCANEQFDSLCDSYEISEQTSSTNFRPKNSSRTVLSTPSVRSAYVPQKNSRTYCEAGRVDNYNYLHENYSNVNNSRSFVNSNTLMFIDEEFDFTPLNYSNRRSSGYATRNASQDDGIFESMNHIHKMIHKRQQLPLLSPIYDDYLCDKEVETYFDNPNYFDCYAYKPAKNMNSTYLHESLQQFHNFNNCNKKLTGESYC